MNETQILFAIACAIAILALAAHLLPERYRRIMEGVESLGWLVGCAVAGGLLLGVWGFLLGLALGWGINAFRGMSRPSHW
jgi:hypothetical protein